MSSQESPTKPTKNVKLSNNAYKRLCHNLLPPIEFLITINQQGHFIKFKQWDSVDVQEKSSGHLGRTPYGGCHTS